MEAKTPERAQIALRVKFIGDLPAVTGTRSVTVRLPEGSSVADLLGSLSALYGEGFSLRLFSRPAKLHHTVVIFVDGVDINERSGLATRLEEGEVELVMLPIICGG